MSKNRRFFVFKLSTNGKTDYMISLAATILHSQKVVLNLAVDFRSRRFAFRGASAEPPRRKLLRGLTCPADPAGVCAPSTAINRA
jgi:hypothetical protein